MPYSAKNHVQYITQLLVHYGVEHAVISPGSRNGAFIMNFNQHPRIKCHTIVDERSAAFFAIGLANQQKKPVAVCCTSGSATVNYYPALVEAFYQNTPLIVISADRPNELVDQFDGQTIRQFAVFEKHLKHNIQISNFNDELPHDKANEIHKAMQDCILKKTPIHFNVPIEEPIYTQAEEKSFLFPELNLAKNQININYNLLANSWNQYKKKLILVGMQDSNYELEKHLIELSQDPSVVILTEKTSNLFNTRFLNQIDQTISFCSDSEFKEMQPELLLTIGQNVISKRIKQFLRKYRPKAHWHLDEFWQPNTYFSLTEELKIQPNILFKNLIPLISKQESSYYNTWQKLESNRVSKHKEYLKNTPFSDLKVFEFIVNHIPESTIVHSSNSSVIRYIQLFPLNKVLYCNRGTSGIDGSTSTAIGFASLNEKPNILITGDLSFFYDSNALFINSIPKNFKIVLINNSGGDIFNIIPGPKTTEALNPFFTAKHNYNAEHLTKMFGGNYKKVNSLNSLRDGWKEFIDSNDSFSVLEIATGEQNNAEVLNSYFRFISEN